MPARRHDSRATVQSTLAAHRAAAAKPVLTWPETVALPQDPADRAAALADFDAVLAARSAGHWRPHHANLIAEYAILGGQVRKLLALLHKSGPLIKSPNNDKQYIRSPVMDALTMISSNRASVAKQLGLVGSHFENDGQGRGQNEARIVTDRAAAANRDGLLAGVDDGLIG